jgi:hypothetical protein
VSAIQPFGDVQFRVAKDRECVERNETLAGALGRWHHFVFRRPALQGRRKSREHRPHQSQVWRRTGQGKVKYETLKPMIGGTLNLKAIRTHWNEILCARRPAASRVRSADRRALHRHRRIHRSCLRSHASSEGIAELSIDQFGQSRGIGVATDQVLADGLASRAERFGVEHPAAGPVSCHTAPNFLTTTLLYDGMRSNLARLPPSMAIFAASLTPCVSST